jgi:hypothetical protein
MDRFFYRHRVTPSLTLLPPAKYRPGPCYMSFLTASNTGA